MIYDVIIATVVVGTWNAYLFYKMKKESKHGK